MSSGVETEVCCPNCRTHFSVTPEVIAKGRMAWSEQSQTFRRMMMTNAEWEAYRRKGSID